MQMQLIKKGSAPPTGAVPVVRPGARQRAAPPAAPVGPILVPVTPGPGGSAPVPLLVPSGPRTAPQQLGSSIPRLKQVELYFQEMADLDNKRLQTMLTNGSMQTVVQLERALTESWRELRNIELRHSREEAALEAEVQAAMARMDADKRSHRETVDSLQAQLRGSLAVLRQYLRPDRCAALARLAEHDVAEAVQAALNAAGPPPPLSSLGAGLAARRPPPPAEQPAGGGTNMLAALMRSMEQTAAAAGQGAGPDSPPPEVTEQGGYGEAMRQLTLAAEAAAAQPDESTPSPPTPPSAAAGTRDIDDEFISQMRELLGSAPQAAQGAAEGSASTPTAPPPSDGPPSAAAAAAAQAAAASSRMRWRRCL
eukprot:TRINITY_DN11969_c0_g3_i1.p1 TRINITY_DN11969_c0_g3~~TRINITY_DN11969_c0_g3_i1.p1  ORF type:complete len:367 (+),score=94.94 TRINITY_DN11969_c0_g3_i1:76-1176(+)